MKAGGIGIKRAVLIIAFATLSVAIALLIGIVAIMCFPYRLLVIALARRFRPDLAGCVKGAGDSVFLYGSETVPTANVCIVLILDGSVTSEEFRKRFRKNVINVLRPDGTPFYARLQQTTTRFMSYGFYRWDKNFNLNDHVRDYDHKGDLALPVTCVTEKDLQNVVGKLISLPYSPVKSHWEFLVVQNFKPNGSGDSKTATILRISHAIADGYSIQDLLFRVSDTPDLRNKFENVRQKRQSFWLKCSRIFMLPFRMIWDAGVQSANLVIDKCDWKIQRLGDGCVETMTVFTNPIPIERIKTIKNFHRVSYASVLLTALSSSIYKIMVQAGQTVPNKMYCILPAPKPNHPGGLINHVYASLMPLPILPNTAASSLTTVDAHFKTVISSTASLFFEIVVGLNSLLPMFFGKYICRTMEASAAVGIFPVLSTPFAVHGSLISGCITFVATLGQSATNGATVSMGGVNGLQRISICMDKRAFPCPEIFRHFAHYIEEEIEEMLQSVQIKNASISKNLDDVKKLL